MIPILLTNRKTLLNAAFSHWKASENKLKIKKMIENLANCLKFRLKTSFDIWSQAKNLMKTQAKLKSIIKILLFSSNIEKYRLSAAFSTWKACDANSKNPWFTKAIGILAKDSMINPQIAYWRMRDFRKKTKDLTAPKIVKLKKMINNIMKAYEIVVSNAFWRIERGRFWRGRKADIEDKEMMSQFANIKVFIDKLLF